MVIFNSVAMLNYQRVPAGTSRCQHTPRSQGAFIEGPVGEPQEVQQSTALLTELPKKLRRWRRDMLIFKGEGLAHLTVIGCDIMRYGMDMVV